MPEVTKNSGQIVPKPCCYRVISTGLGAIMAAIMGTLVATPSTAQVGEIPSVVNNAPPDLPGVLPNPLLDRLLLDRPSVVQEYWRPVAESRVAETFPPFPERNASDEYPDLSQRGRLLGIWWDVRPWLDGYRGFGGHPGADGYDLTEMTELWVDENYQQLQPIWTALDNFLAPSHNVLSQDVLRKTHKGIAQFLKDLRELEEFEIERLDKQIQHIRQRKLLFFGPDAAAIAANPPAATTLSILQKRYYPELDPPYELNLILVGSDGDERVVDQIEFYGGPYHLEAVYEDATNVSAINVTITSGSTQPGSGDGESRTFELNRLASNPKILRSSAIYFLPPTLDDGPAPSEGPTP